MSSLDSLELLKTACSNCSLRELCMPVGLSVQEILEVEHLVSERRLIPKGGYLFKQEGVFEALFVIRAGFLKTTVTTTEGRAQITGFQMAGEILGLEGIVHNRHSCDAVALEDSQVCVLPYAQLEALCRQIPGLHSHVHKIMSREIVREHSVILLLGSMNAEERLAAFLLNLLHRMGARGYSTQEMVLRMTRQDIGNYLGLKLETISRTLRKFVIEGFIALAQRHIKVLNVDALKHLVTPEVCH